MGASILVQKIFNPTEVQITAGPYFAVELSTVETLKQAKTPLEVVGFWLYQRSFVLGVTRESALTARSGISTRTYRRLMADLRNRRMAVTESYCHVTQTAVLSWPMALNSYTATADLFSTRVRREIDKSIRANAHPGWQAETAREFFNLRPTMVRRSQQFSSQVVITFVEKGPGRPLDRLRALGLWLIMSFAERHFNWEGARQTARRLDTGKSRVIGLFKLLAEHRLIHSDLGIVRVFSGVDDIQAARIGVYKPVNN